MKLQLALFPVNKIIFENFTGYKEGVLSVDKTDLTALVQADDRIRNITIDITSPGDDARIIHVLDVLQPRAKTIGSSFPGISDKPERCGYGTTYCLDGMAVVMTGQYDSDDALLTVEEAIVDMSGSCAPYSPLSKLNNLVVSLETVEGLTGLEFEEVFRLAGTKIAQFLAGKVLSLPPVETRLISQEENSEQLPRVVLICQLTSLGPLAENYIYGRPVDNMLPLCIYPSEIVDGAIVSGNYHYASQRNCTIFHQNNPVIMEMFSRHNKDMTFAGAILTRGFYNTHEDKLRAAFMVASQAALLEADGVVITSESMGNSVIDVMLTCRECEKLGIKTTLMLPEMVDNETHSFGLVDYVNEADAIVSVGDREQIVDIPEVTRVLGGGQILKTMVPATEAQKVPVRDFLGSTNQLGSWNLTVRDY